MTNGDTFRNKSSTHESQGSEKEALLENGLALNNKKPKLRALLVANTYPSPGALYRNAFLHRRVLAYKREGLDVEVFYLHPPLEEGYEYTFEGVKVAVGNQSHYEKHLEKGQYDRLLLHFVSPQMWEPLLRAGNFNTPTVVWIHGFEAEKWFRRWFTFLGDTEGTNRALEQKDNFHREQLNLLRRIFSGEKPNVTVVNVSHWFLDNVVVPDVGATPEQGVVIPNYVDENLFRPSEFSPERRKRILTIRPFASRKYANDLTVAAIQELSRRPYFADLTFTIVGEGPLFEETTAPLKGFGNVELVNKFLTQEEVAALHKHHGVFLCPTRFDSQGVSMCEAMASGLVPVSTSVSAIPEFVTDDRSGLLSVGEDPIGLADSIERLYFNPELFERLTKNAASEVTRQCGWDETIGRELEVITHEEPVIIPEPPDDWESRYLALEDTLEEMIKFAASETQRKEEPKFYWPVINKTTQGFEVQFPVNGDEARFAFWVYEDKKLVRKIPYSYCTSLIIEPVSGARYRIRAFAASKNAATWSVAQDFDLGVLVGTEQGK